MLKHSFKIIINMTTNHDKSNLNLQVYFSTFLNKLKIKVWPKKKNRHEEAWLHFWGNCQFTDTVEEDIFSNRPLLIFCLLNREESCMKVIVKWNPGLENNRLLKRLEFFIHSWSYITLAPEKINFWIIF